MTATVAERDDAEKERNYRFIDAPAGIPPDVVERWTRRLAMQWRQTEDRRVTSNPRLIAEGKKGARDGEQTDLSTPQRHGTKLLDRFRLERYRAQWAQVLNEIMWPDRLMDVSVLKQVTAELERACQMSARVEFLKGSARHEQWLVDNIEKAKRYVLVVSTRFSKTMVTKLQDAIERAAARQEVALFFLWGSARRRESR